MKLVLRRSCPNDRYRPGSLWIDDVFFCWTLEPPHTLPVGLHALHWATGGPFVRMPHGLAEHVHFGTRDEPNTIRVGTHRGNYAIYGCPEAYGRLMRHLHRPSAGQTLEILNDYTPRE